MKLLILSLLLFGQVYLTYGQTANLWATYGQARSTYAPGIEANYFFTKYLGVQLGVGTYIKKTHKAQFVNLIGRHEPLLYDNTVNLGLSVYLLERKSQLLGATLGANMYNGPDYQHLYYYEEEGYDVYYDLPDYKTDFGLDIGLFYAYKRLTAIIKFNTARKLFHFGLGYNWKRKTAKTGKT